MGMKRRIKKTTGYPTTDDKSFPTWKEAMQHQTDIDLDAMCELDKNVNSDDLKKFLSNKKQLEAVNEYVKHHLTPKKAPAKKSADNKAGSK